MLGVQQPARDPLPNLLTIYVIRVQVSAGYDAHWRDPLAGLQFSDGGYHTLCTSLKTLANQLCHGRLVFLLEVTFHAFRA